MPTLYLIADKPVDFTISGGWGRGWVTSQKWQPKSTNFFSPDVMGFETENMPEFVTVGLDIEDVISACAGRPRAPNQGFPIYELQYEGDALPARAVPVAKSDGTTLVTLYPVLSKNCEFTGAVHLSHIHKSLRDIRPNSSNSVDDDVSLLLGEPRPQSRWAKISSAPSNAWHYLRGNRSGYTAASAEPMRRDTKAKSGFRAGLSAFGHSLSQTVRNWGPVFLMAAAGISLFYLTGGTSLLMNWFLAMGTSSAAAATLTTIATLGIGMVAVGVCKAAYRGFQGAAYYGNASVNAVKVRYAVYTESRAEAANEAQHQQAMLLAEQLGYDLAQGTPAQFEAAYNSCDSAHRAKLLERELLMFNQVRAAGTDPKAKAAAEEAAQRDLAAITAEPQHRRAAPGATVTAY